MVKLLDKDVPTPVVVGAALAAPLVLRAGSKLLFGGAHSVVQNGRFKGQPLAQDVYDAVIVGAGPSGSTCAHFFAKASRGAAARHAKPSDSSAGFARPLACAFGIQAPGSASMVLRASAYHGAAHRGFGLASVREAAAQFSRH